MALPGQIIRCSVDSSGNEFSYISRSPDISADGRYAAFESFGEPKGSTRRPEVFWRDTLTGITHSLAELTGTESRRMEPKISADGRYLIFTSDGESSFYQTYRADLVSGTIVLVSCNAAAQMADQGGAQPAVGADGRYVVFSSTASNLVPGISGSNVYRKDLQTGAITCVSCDASSQPLNYSSAPCVSLDGRFVGYLFTDDGAMATQYRIYRKDLLTGELATCSCDADGNLLGIFGGDCSISGDGRYVGFEAFSTAPTPGETDLFRKDLVTGELLLGSSAAWGERANGRNSEPSFSADGRYMCLASTGNNLFPLADEGYSQLLLKDFLTGGLSLCSQNTSGESGNGDSGGYSHSQGTLGNTISDDGRFIAFSSAAMNLMPNSSNVYADIFRLELASEGLPPAVPAGFGNISYLAEGYTGQGFHEYLTFANRSTSLASLQVIFEMPQGAWLEQDFQVPAMSRSTLDVNNTIGGDKEASVRIASDQPIVVERPMYFDYGGRTGGHVVTATPSPSAQWYFAEGYTGPGFDQYVCVFNPSDAPAALDLHFQVQSVGRHDITGLTVPAHSRATFRVNSLLGEGNENSLELDSSVPVVAERAMYFEYGGWTGGSCVMGATALSTAYYFAEGNTQDSFAEYLTLQNPSASTFAVQAEYQFFGSFPPLTKSYELPANSRQTYFVPFQTFRGQDVSVKLTSASPFLAERPMYFDYTGYGADWTGGHCVIGASAPASEWFFAEGCTLPGFHEYLCLQNPGDSDATVEIIYLTQEAGALPVQTAVVPAHSRITSLVNIAAGEGYQLSCRVRVVSGPAIVAERPMYFDYNGWDGGHDALGVVP